MPEVLVGRFEDLFVELIVDAGESQGSAGGGLDNLAGDLRAARGVAGGRFISFGQAMPEDKMARAIKYAGDCDFCIALGSSLIVYPAASVPSHAAKSGAKLMIINREETPLDSMADLVIHDSVSKILNEIVSA